MNGTVRWMAKRMNAIALCPTLNVPHDYVPGNGYQQRASL
jgi:hypothetical protein